MSSHWAKEGLVLTGAEYISRAFGFVLTLAISHSMGVDALASVALAISITGFATVAGDAGLGTHAVRLLVHGTPVRNVVRDTARVQIALTAVVLIPAWVWAAIATDWAMASALAIVPIASAARAGYVLQAELRAKELAVSRVVGNLTTAVLGLAAVALGASLPVVALSYGIGALSSLAYVQWRIRQPLGLSLGPPSVEFIRTTWRHQLALAGYTIALYAYYNVLLVTVSIVGTSAALNDVAVATRVAAIFTIPATSVTAVLLPRFAADARLRWHRFAGLGAAAGAACAAVIIAASPALIPALFGPEAAGAVGATQILMLEMPIGLANGVLAALVLGRGKYRSAFVAYAAAVAVQVLAVLALAHRSSAAMSSSFVASSLVLFALLVTFARGRRLDRVPAR